MEYVTPPLDEYVEIQELHETVQGIFTTTDSLRWFVRRNRPLLVKSGALIIVAGRMRFHPARFKSAVVEAGQKAAA